VITALLALLLSFAAHLTPAPAPHGSDSAGIGLVHPTLASPAAPTAATVAPAAPVWVRCPAYPAANPPEGCQGPTVPWTSAPSWDDRTTPPADLGEWTPATDVPMCVPNLGIVVDCWTP
jgi:hypothetical protein